MIKHVIHPTTLSDSTVKILFNKIYEQFVEEIDAVDNGIAQTEEKPK